MKHQQPEQAQQLSKLITRISRSAESAVGTMAVLHFADAGVVAEVVIPRTSGHTPKLMWKVLQTELQKMAKDCLLPCILVLMYGCPRDVSVVLIMAWYLDLELLR